MHDTLHELGTWLRSIHWGWLYVGLLGIFGLNALVVVVQLRSYFWPRWATVALASFGMLVNIAAILYGYSLWTTYQGGTSLPKHQRFSGGPEILVGISFILWWGRVLLQSLRRD